jgi:hypothetical protein
VGPQDVPFQQTIWDVMKKSSSSGYGGEMRVYPYDQNLWPSTVEGDVNGLTDRIKGTWDSREAAVMYMQILTTGPQAVKA